MTLARSAALALAAGAFLAGPALAQTAQTRPTAATAPVRAAGSGSAAATLPNSFDGPAAAPVATTAPLPTAPGGSATEVAAAEGVLRAIIGQMQAGDLDEALFTPTLAARLNGELAAYRPVLQGYGAVQSIEAQGAQGSAGQFLVTFANAATQWRIGLDDSGRVAALLFREAPPESSEPVAAAGD